MIKIKITLLNGQVVYDSVPPETTMAELEDIVMQIVLQLGRNQWQKVEVL
jgi:hypothetical protein